MVYVQWHWTGGTGGAGPSEVHGNKLSFSTLCAYDIHKSTIVATSTASHSRPSAVSLSNRVLDPIYVSAGRYHAGANQLAALRRAKISIGTDEMKRLLQTVAEGFTEHSLVAKLNTLELEVAYGNLDGLWDAPYSTWHVFHFDDCFIAASGATTTSVCTPKL